jgi:uncharacterized protein (DUF2141 family)
MRKVLYLFLGYMLVSCANQTTPTGGPKDDTAPKLLTSNPSNNSKNFSRTLLEFEFDEDIQTNNPNEEILITPTVGKKTKFMVKRNKLIITPELPWKENTTYNINFRDGVQDITERNRPENLQIAFSTGPEIDSLHIKGTIREALKETVPENVTVALYQSDTFNIYTDVPTYFTKSNKKGEYQINNLKGGTFTLYAFQDKNKNLKADSRSEKFGFLATPVTLDTSYRKKKYEVRLMQVDTRNPKINTIRNSEIKSRVRLNKPIDSLIIERQNDDTISYHYVDGQAEIDIYHYLHNTDSIPIHVSALDSASQRMDTVIYIKKGEAKFIKEDFKFSKLSELIDYSHKKLVTEYTFNKPLQSIELDSIYIQLDSITRTTISKTDILVNSIKKKATLFFPIKTDTATKYALHLGKSAFISDESDSSKSLKSTIVVKNKEDLGTLLIEVSTTAKSYIIQLLDKDGKISGSIKNATKHIFQNIEPGEYKLRIHIDENDNGKWDPGNISNLQDSEKIEFYKNSEGKYSFPIRANWEVGPLLIKF